MFAKGANDRANDEFAGQFAGQFLTDAERRDAARTSILAQGRMVKARSGHGEPVAGAERLCMKEALRHLFGQAFYYSERREAWLSVSAPDRMIRHHIDRGKVRWLLYASEPYSVEPRCKDITDAVEIMQSGQRHVEGSNDD